jgi:AraC-like DNA-binding protein
VELIEAQGAALLLYCGVRIDTMSALAEYARVGSFSLVIRGMDQSLHELRRVLFSAARNSLSESLIAGLNDRLRTLPAEIGETIRILLRHSARFGSTRHLALQASMPRRTFDRWLARGSLPPARRLWHAARVLWGYDLLQQSAVVEVAQQLGHSSAKLFAREVRHVVGVPPSSLSRMDGNEVIERIHVYLELLPLGRAAASLAFNNTDGRYVANGLSRVVWPGEGLSGRGRGLQPIDDG